MLAGKYEGVWAADIWENGLGYNPETRTWNFIKFNESLNGKLTKLDVGGASSGAENVGDDDQ
jgi:hypothetical protein